MANDAVDDTLLRQAVRYLLEQGASINLIGETDVPEFKIDGHAVNASQVVLKAYAAGMADVAYA